MELMEGGSLLNYIKKNGSSLPLQKKLDILLQIGRGLQHLHEHNIIHRDLAARNCLVNYLLAV